jgi:iron complex transport system ATP-binding protein
MTDLVLDQLGVTLNRTALLAPLRAAIAPGTFLAVVGANGAGKSTLLRAVAGLVPTTGDVRRGDALLSKLPHAARARHIAYLPQAHDAAWAMPVRAMVALGRYAHGRGDADGDSRVAAALALCGLEALADRRVDRLSGGERALTALARVLATDAPVMLLDEPVAALDVGRQYAILERLAALTDGGAIIVAVLHDLSLAAQFARRILWIDRGALVADTDASRAAISAHTPGLLGRTPHWAEGASGAALPFFSR